MLSTNIHIFSYWIFYSVLLLPEGFKIYTLIIPYKLLPVSEKFYTLFIFFFLLCSDIQHKCVYIYTRDRDRIIMYAAYYAVYYNMFYVYAKFDVM